MSSRTITPHTLAPDAFKALIAVEKALGAGPIPHTLAELVKLRISQINGCAFCIHMHSTDLRRHGESEMRLYMLNAWRESTLYSARERAALGWAEALTHVAETGAPEADYAALAAEFTPEEQSYLTLSIGMINLWNRLQVGFRAPHPAEADAAA